MVDENGQRTVGLTSAQRSAQNSNRQFKGGPLYQSRALTPGGGLDGFMRKIRI